MTKDPTSEKSSLHPEENMDESETTKSNEKKFRQPDSCWSWIVCAAGVICHIIVLGCAYCFGLIFPSLLEEFKQGKSNTAWVGSMAMAAPGLIGPLSGRLTDHFGARVIVICGSLLCTAGLLFTSLVPSLYLMFLTYGGIFGCGASFVFIAFYGIVPRYFVKHRSLATGIITVSAGGAYMVMSPVSQALLTAFGWRGVFRGLGCIVLIVFFLGWTLDLNVTSNDTDAAFGERKESQAPRRKGMLDFSIWKNKTFAVLNISCFFIDIGHFLPPLHLARYCEDLGIAEDLATWLYTCIGLASVLARLTGSKLCDVISPHRVFLTFTIVSAMSSLLLPLATSWIGLLCFAIFYGLADGCMAVGAVLTCLQTLTPKQTAQGYGFFQLIVCTAGLCGPPIGGVIADKTNSYHAAFISAGAIEFFGVFTLSAYFCFNKVELPSEKIEIDPDTCSSNELLVVEKVSVL